MADDEKADLPGCGIGAYVALLAVICVIGMSGLAISSYSLVKYSQVPPSPLVPGTQVPVWRLQPLRDAGILGLTDTPPAWHDESPRADGTTVCALMATELVRLEKGAPTRVPYDHIADVKFDGAERTGGPVVTSLKEGGEVRCTFGIEEGGSRFLRQLRAEAGLPNPEEPP